MRYAEGTAMKSFVAVEEFFSARISTTRHDSAGVKGFKTG
jgi:hypothetical protein